MKKMKILRTATLNLVLLSVICLSTRLNAQVTIGSGLEPNKGALLDLKERNPNNPTIDNSTADKGMVMPRIKLTSMNTLVDINGGTGKETEHTGLTVYNLSTTNGFEPGIYIWDGTKWMVTKASASTSDDSWSLDGNAGTTTGTNFLGTTDLQGLAFKTNNAERIRITSTGNVGIGTTTPSAALHINGDMKLATAPAYTGADVMVRNSDGSIGVAAPEAPINKVMYAQSSTAQNISSTDLNNLNAGTAVVVTWAVADVLNYGGLMTKNTDNSFTFNEKSLCEVSGYVNYTPNAKVPETYVNNWNESVAALNVTIQYALSTSPNTWIDLTGSRHVFAEGAMGAIQSIVVPAAIMTFNKNDKIRMVIKRPNSSFGVAHGTSATSSTISAPTGSKFSKGLKITTM